MALLNHNTDKQKGVTLLEVLTSMCIASTLAYIAIPQAGSLLGSLERSNVRGSVLQDLRRAQAETVTHGCRGILAVASDGRSYNYGCDYLAYDTVSPPSADSIMFTRVLPVTFKIAVDAPVIFNSRGQIVDEGGLLDQRRITLSEGLSGHESIFSEGTILGTGIFEYD